MAEIKAVDILINEINEMTKCITVKENETLVKTPAIIIKYLSDGFTFWEFTVELSKRVKKFNGKFERCTNIETCFEKIRTTDDIDLKFLYTFEFIMIKNKILPDSMLDVCFKA